MRINILASLGKYPGGANRNFLEFGDRLVQRGNEVTIIKAANRGALPGKKNFQGKVKEFFHLISGPRVRPYRVEWLSSRAKMIAVPSYQDPYLPVADVTLFSSPRLIGVLSSTTGKIGKKVFRVADPFFPENPTPYPGRDVFMYATASLIKRLLEEKFPDRKIYLVNNGVNTKLFHNPGKVFRSRFQVIGMLFYQKRPKRKGMEDAIKAFEIVKAKYPDVRFHCAGFRRERWLPSWIEFWNGCDQQNLCRFYSSLDIFVFPSLLDPSPNPPLEAMACQAALVTTDVGGIRDYTQPGKTALVSPPGQPELLAKNIITLIENPVFLKEISIAGWQKAQTFSYENQAEKLEAVLREIISS